MSRQDLTERDIGLIAPAIETWTSGVFNRKHKAAKKLSMLKRDDLVAIAQKLEISTNQNKFYLASSILKLIMERSP